MEKLNKIKDLMPIPSFGVIFVCFFFPFIILQCGGREVVSLTGSQLAIGTEIDKSKLDKNKLMNSILGDDESSLTNTEDEETVTKISDDASTLDENTTDEETSNADEYTEENTSDEAEAATELKGEDKKLGPSFILLIPMLLAAVGFILGFIKFRRKPLVFTLISVVGFVCLLLFKLAWMAKMNESLGGMGDDDFGMSMMINVKFGNAFYLAMFLYVAIALFFMYYLYENKNFEEKQLAIAEAEAIYNYDDLEDETEDNN